MQWVTLDTIVGPKQLPAPDGWQFGKTDVIVWARLMDCVEIRQQGVLKRRRDEHVFDGKIDELANVLANAHGMASPYWINAAKELTDG
jgi:hypothetical protein